MAVGVAVGGSCGRRESVATDVFISLTTCTSIMSFTVMNVPQAATKPGSIRAPAAAMHQNGKRKSMLRK